MSITAGFIVQVLEEIYHQWKHDGYIRGSRLPQDVYKFDSSSVICIDSRGSGERELNRSGFWIKLKLKSHILCF